MRIIEVLLLLYFTFISAYALVLAIAASLYRHAFPSGPTSFRTIAILIPAYREDAVIVSVAKQALLQDYPPERFRVIVIADSLKAETLLTLRTLDIELVEVTFDVSTKVKALNAALSRYSNSFEYALILDADNVMQ